MSNLSLVLKLSHNYVVRCYRNGNLRWEEIIDNLVVTVGQNDILNKYYTGVAYTAANFIGLTTGTPVFAASDTMASHVGWTEFSAYSEATRVAPTWGTAAGGIITSPAVVFNITGPGTVGGSFLTTDSAILGSAGILVGGAVFSANRTVDTPDAINITPTAVV